MNIQLDNLRIKLYIYNDSKSSSIEPFTLIIYSMVHTRWIFLLISLLLIAFATYQFSHTNFSTSSYTVGDSIDTFNGVHVYYNGRVGNVTGRNTTADGYNLGLKYQCVEFVKRYYYEYLGHKMPNSYGHAKDFFNPSLQDGQVNKDRNLTQYSNTSSTKPQVSDLVVFGGTAFNKYGHVAIISAVRDNQIEVIQQNTGRYGRSRDTYDLSFDNDKWTIKNNRILGWLRKE